MDSAHAGEAGARRAATFQRLDKHRNRIETIRVYDLPDRFRLHPALQLDHLAKAGHGGAPVDLDDPAVGQIALDGVFRTHDLARRAVHHLELLDIAAGVDVAGDPGSLGAPALLVDESARIGELLRRFVDLAQPVE